MDDHVRLIEVDAINLSQAEIEWAMVEDRANHFKIIQVVADKSKEVARLRKKYENKYDKAMLNAAGTSDATRKSEARLAASAEAEALEIAEAEQKRLNQLHVPLCRFA